MISILSKLGLQTAVRAEGLAFFLGDEQDWMWLPSIRLMRTGGVLITMVHASDALTMDNAAAINSTPVDVYQRIMNGILRTEKLYQEYSKKGTYVSVNRP